MTKILLVIYNLIATCTWVKNLKTYKFHIPTIFVYTISKFILWVCGCVYVSQVLFTENLLRQNKNTKLN